MKEKLFLLGGGGHGKSVIDIILSENKYDLIGIIDFDPKRHNDKILGIPILGDKDKLTGFLKSGINNAFVSIGDNKSRKNLQNNLEDMGFNIVNIISSRGYVSPHSHLGKGVVVMHNAIINAGCKIGDGVIVNTNASIDHDCCIKDFCHIAPGVTICGEVSVGELTFIGAGAKVISQVKIGKEVVVGAGGVVVKNVVDFKKVVGVPAK